MRVPKFSNFTVLSFGLIASFVPAFADCKTPSLDYNTCSPATQNSDGRDCACGEGDYLRMSDATLRLMTTPHPGISLVQSNGRMKVDSSFATTKNGQPSKGCELKSVNGLPISQAFAVEPAGWWPRTSTFQLDLICSGANVVRSFTSVDLLQQMDFSGGAYGAYDFGLRVRPIRGGMLVVAVASNSPAEIAGVRVGMRVNGAKFLRSSSLSISLIDRLNQPYDRSGIELSIENKEDSRRVIIFPITLPVLLRNVLRPNGTIKGNKDGVRFTD